MYMRGEGAGNCDSTAVDCRPCDARNTHDQGNRGPWLKKPKHFISCWCKSSGLDVTPPSRDLQECELVGYVLAGNPNGSRDVSAGQCRPFETPFVSLLVGHHPDLMQVLVTCCVNH
jgi:hypothetical protein